MPIKEQLFYSVFILSSIGLICFAYQKNDSNFWKYYDSGFLLLAFTLLMIMRKHYLLCISFLFLLVLALNSWITSMFFDVKIFGINQNVFGWLLASIVLTFGIIYNSIKYILEQKKRKEDILCKKDARDKYKNLLNKFDHIENKIDMKLNNLDTIIQTLSNG